MSNPASSASQSLVRPLAVAEFKPFTLVRRSRGIDLYEIAHGRKKTVIERLRVKTATRAFRRLQRAGQPSLGVARSEGLGREFSFDARNTQFHAIYEYAEKGYEIDVMGAILTFLPADGVFVDVGANWGYFALAVAASPRFNGRVLAFEAFPPSFADLDGIRSQLQIDGARLQAEAMALSRSEGTAYLGVGNGQYSGLIKVSSEQTGVAVPKKPLDAFALARLDVMKIDVEGHELDVLEGAAATLERCRPVICLENWFDIEREQGTRELAALEFLADRDYALFIPALTDASGQPVLLDLRRTQAAELFLRGMPFVPSQRGFFDKRVNVLAIPRERAHELPC